MPSDNPEAPAQTDSIDDAMRIVREAGAFDEQIRQFAGMYADIERVLLPSPVTEALRMAPIIRVPNLNTEFLRTLARIRVPNINFDTGILDVIAKMQLAAPAIDPTVLETLATLSDFGRRPILDARALDSLARTSRMAVAGLPALSQTIVSPAILSMSAQATEIMQSVSAGLIAQVSATIAAGQGPKMGAIAATRVAISAGTGPKQTHLAAAAVAAAAAQAARRATTASIKNAVATAPDPRRAANALRQAAFASDPGPSELALEAALTASQRLQASWRIESTEDNVPGAPTKEGAIPPSVEVVTQEVIERTLSVVVAPFERGVDLLLQAIEQQTQQAERFEARAINDQVDRLRAEAAAKLGFSIQTLLLVDLQLATVVIGLLTTVFPS